MGLNKTTLAAIIASMGGGLPLNSRIAYEGDSITAFELTNAQTYQFYAHIQSGAKLYYPKSANLAVGGEQIGPRGNSPVNYMAKAAEIAAVVAQTPDVVHFWGGTNDIAHGDLNDALIFADLQTCLTGYFAGGAKYVIVGTVIPHNTFGDAGWTGAMETARLALNARIQALPSWDSRVKVADYAAGSWDLTAALTTYQSDGVHPNFVGMRIPGDILAPILTSITAAGTITPLYLDASNLLLSANNPALTGTSGSKSAGVGSAPTGTVATSWTVKNNLAGVVPTCSMTTLNGSVAQQIDVSGTTSGASGSVRFNTTCAYSGLTGEGYEAWFEFELAAGSVNLRGLEASCDTSVSISNGAPTDMSNTGLSGVIRTKLTTPLAAGDVSSVVQLSMIFGAVGAVGASIKISKPVFRKITAAAPQ